MDKSRIRDVLAGLLHITARAEFKADVRGMQGILALVRDAEETVRALDESLRHGEPAPLTTARPDNGS
jgi:hypothetical protein